MECELFPGHETFGCVKKDFSSLKIFGDLMAIALCSLLSLAEIEGRSLQSEFMSYDITDPSLLTESTDSLTKFR